MGATESSTRQYRGSGYDVACRDEIDVCDPDSLCQWCREMGKDQSNTALRRFAIGHYQVAQAHEWGSCSEVYTEWAACVVHVVAAAEMRGIRMVEWLSPLDASAESVSEQQFIHAMAKAQQMHVYADEGPGRARRYRPDMLASATRQVVDYCVSRIPVPLRRVHVAAAIAQCENKEWTR